MTSQLCTISRHKVACVLLGILFVISLWNVIRDISNVPRTLLTPTYAGDNKGQKLLCVRFLGRFGNQLFQYASTLGLALSLNRTPVFLTTNNLLRPVLKHFTIPPYHPELETRCSKATTLRESGCCKFDERLTQLDPKLDYTIGHYLASYRYFEKHEAEIREAIVFSDDIRNESSAVVGQFRQKYNTSTLIGVHIRRGDITSERNQKLGYVVPSIAYINRSMTFFLELYPQCVFVVASDSLQWCKDNFPAGFHVHYLAEQRTPAVDMSIVAAMDHTIISFGTFSWWIGFLNAGKTVVMKDYIRMDTWLGESYNPEGRDVIYPEWIRL